ncbi:YggS family pyridoxal phosphate-dependent enzyme [Candidatus Pelagibacter sp.]|nr:YggS family pyridoxal phosphate-dependent enzyme [Candidatus Pelagibacter sp.]MDC0441992.1 YggS family pyridoxal phosphate-dependent enzyme [Candidatus Pelagibacter sp.]MDC0982225.1 YggS family pyridoxal phosphate-dependent enzyme [Candidatus Pelagibacter sp.]
MHKSITNLDSIKEDLKSKVQDFDNLKIIAVSKTFSIDQILPLIKHGHLHYGENKVQEAINKWSDVKLEYSDIKLHLIGRLQSNKTKLAVKLFDYIHSVDSEKIAKKIADEELKQNKKVKIFIQVNIGDENQKSGITKKNLNEFYSYCKELELDILGLMCIPPANIDPKFFFQEMKLLTKKLDLPELSMGMSSDYIEAAKNSATYLRIGSKIFGNRD